MPQFCFHSDCGTIKEKGANNPRQKIPEQIRHSKLKGGKVSDVAGAMWKCSFTNYGGPIT